MIGEQILDYRIDKLLGEGGMGTVYLASHTQLNKQIAIKVLNPYLVGNTNIREHIKNEAAALLNLRHTNIVSLYYYLEAGNNLCLVMEYVEGISLNHYIQHKNGPIPEDKAIHIFLQILDAFAYAHNKGIIHGDIKSANIMLTGDEEPKILDFGIARILNGPSANLTMTGIRRDTILYMSPEQIHGKQADIRSDIYSLGVMLFEMLTGQSLYNPEISSEFNIQSKIVNQPLPRVKTLYPYISEKMQAIIDKATAKNPEDRFQTCEAIKESLMAAEELQQELILAQLMQEVAEKGENQIKAENTSTIEAAKIQSRNKKLKIAFIVFALLIGAFYVFRFSMLKEASNFDWSTFRLKTATNETNAADASVPEQENRPFIENNPSLPGKRTASASMEGRESAGSDKLSLPASKTNLTKQDFQLYLTEYYKSLQAKNLNGVQMYYAPPLTRFFSEYGVSSERLDELFEQAWRRTPEDRHEILWDTFRFYKDDEDNYIMDFYMNYHYRRAGKNAWRQQKLYTMIKMNKDFKIFYITGD